MKTNLKHALLSLPVFGLLLFPALSGAANAGVASRPNEVQTNPVNTKRSQLPTMSKPSLLGTAGHQPVIKFKTTQQMPMLSQALKPGLKHRLTNKPDNNSMPAIGRSITISKGHGLQIANQRTARQPMMKKEAPGYLHVVMEVSKNGKVRILSAVKVNGRAVNSREALGDFIYNIRIANKGVLVQAIPDPFEMRSFPGPAGSGLQGHHFEQAPTARLIVKIPASKATLRQLSTIRMDMYKLKPGYQIQRISPDIFKRLKIQNRLKTVVTIPALKLAPLIKQKLILTPR